MKFSAIIGLLIVFIFGSCGTKKEASFRFVSVPPEQSKINFSNILAEEESFNIVDYLYYYNGGGVAIGDINADGLLDILFSSNEGDNQLYLNKGALQFEDITELAGVASHGKWKTGVSMIDVNGDQLLDIYVCRVSGYKGLEGHNELYINNGDLTFTESADKFGLDFKGLSTQVAFFDMDNDGDLDVYLLNHAVHTQKSHGRASLRQDIDSLSGDRILENIEGKFFDITGSTGIYSSQIGYGLGVGLSDFNQDGFTDLYISNDFSENDYLYLNNGDKTFTESLTKMAHHTSRFSMGNDIADFNNDGLVDIITLDMLPEDEVVRKQSVGEDPYEIFKMKLSYGYMNQYSRNTLMLNRGGKFSDIAMLAGIHATDWSWSPLFADFDNDGWKDLFISNGIVRRPNDLDYIDFISDQEVKANASLSDAAFVAQMPKGVVKNYFYSNSRDLSFEDVSDSWIQSTAKITNGTAYADLDNDGDLDLVLNNLNEPSEILQNLTIENDTTRQTSNFLKLKFFSDNGHSVLGTKVESFAKGKKQFHEVYQVRGFQSATANELLIGLGHDGAVDSLIIRWPNGAIQKKGLFKANQGLTFSMPAAPLYPTSPPKKLSQVMFKDLTAALKIDFKHAENSFVEFNREPLIPHMNSQEGPAISVADVDGDGRDDFYVGGAKNQPGRLYIQESAGFLLAQVFLEDQIFEDVDAIFFDIELDGDLDLLVVTGGNEFDKNAPEELSRIYLNDGAGHFSKAEGLLPDLYETGAVVAIYDVNGDGYQDIFLGRVSVPWHYGKSPTSHLLLNQKGVKFEVAPDSYELFAEAGMVKDALWADLDGNGEKDLILAALWQPIKICYSHSRKLSEPISIARDKGWWQTVEAIDYDQDGDLDLIAGNLGLNSKLQASAQEPVRLYLRDFDNNDRLDPILTYYKQAKESIFVPKKDLTKQLPSLKKKFLDYKTYAQSTPELVFGENEWKAAKMLEAQEFRSGVYINNNGQFDFEPFDNHTQMSMVRSIIILDFNRDSVPDFLMAGNFHGSSIEEGRYSEDYGALYISESRGLTYLPNSIHELYLEGQIRYIEPIIVQGKPAILVARNNDYEQIFGY